MAQPKMYRVRMGNQGRLVVPAGLRREFGVGPDDVLVGWIDEDDRLIFQRREDIEKEIWALVPRSKKLKSDELIRERRREAARETEREDRHRRSR